MNNSNNKRLHSSLWRNNDYLLMWSGQAVSSTGTQISQIAFPLLVLMNTQSPAQAGLVGAIRALPYLLLSLPAGVLVDRWDRKWVMILCDLGRAVSLASIPIAALAGHLTVLQLYINAAIEGTLFIFFNLAETACVPQVVTIDQVPSVMAQYQATEGVTTLLGPFLSGILFKIGSTIPFALDAFSYFVSSCTLFCIKTKFQEERTQEGRHIFPEMLEGLLWLWKQPLIRLLALLACGANIIFSCSPLVVIIIAQHMHASSFTIGLIFAIGGGGGILGALLGNPIQKRFRFGTIIIAIWWIWTLLWLSYAVAPGAIVLGIITAIFALTNQVYNVVQFSYRLALIPDKLQGRVNSTFRLIAFGGQPFSLALSGLLLQISGILPTILLFAAFLILLSLLTTTSRWISQAKSFVQT